MLIVIPTATDAPCYHIPFATGGMILLNIIVLIAQYAIPGFTETFMLNHGSFNPITWITSSVMHAGVAHLIGNMIVLSICGWIIEGKVGWWQFLLIYFGIAFVSGAIEQTIMLFFEGTGSLGASGVVFGMITIVMLWAPENEVTLLVMALIFFRPLVTTFNVSVLLICFLMIAMEFLTASLTGFAMSSAVLHLMGAVPGAMIGIVMLKKRWVDCEGYDLISIQQGKRGQRTPTVQQERELEQRKQEAKQARREAFEAGQQKIGEYLRGGHFEMALHRYENLKRKNHQWDLSEHQRVELINGLWADPEKQAKAVPLIEGYLKNHKTLAVPLTLRLARYRLLVEQRPRACLTLLKSINEHPMDAKQSRIAQQLNQHSRQMINDGVVDFSDS